MPDHKSRRALDVEPRIATNYPRPLDERVRGRARRALGNLFGLDQFGVNFTELAPGSMSALRHWHTQEDEFVYVLSGELVLATDAGEEVLRAGDCIGFKAGVPDGHHLINRATTPATYLEIGSRRPDIDAVFYPDDDLELRPDGGGRRRFVRKDGTPC
jgi:uncharacterized cupin superfamily protein